MELSKNNNNINEFLEAIYSIIQENVESHVPKFELKTSNFPQYFSQTLKHKIILKRKMHFLYKFFNSPFFEEAFKNLRKECKYLQITDYNNFISNLNNNYQQNPKLI